MTSERSSDYSKYRMFKILDETIQLLNVADFELLKKHYEKFADKINGVKKKVIKILKGKVVLDEKIIVKRLKFLVQSESLSEIKDHDLNENNINIIKFIKKIILMIGFLSVCDKNPLYVKEIKQLLFGNISKTNLIYDFEKLRLANEELRNIDPNGNVFDKGQYIRNSINQLLELVGLRLEIIGDIYKPKHGLLWTANIDNNLNFKNLDDNDKKWQTPIL
jgi:hypothetical protein